MKKAIYLLLIISSPIIINAEEPVNAVDYIKNIAISNGGNENSIEIIGDTDLAYDNTIDKNLRYVGVNPDNYVDIGDIYKTDIYEGQEFYNDTIIYKFYSTIEECQNSNYFNNNCKKVHSKDERILWRIIGVMNNIDKDGKKETKLKLIRDEGLGFTIMDPYDFNLEYSSNEWKNTDLNKILNEGFDNNQEMVYKYNVNSYESIGVKNASNSLYWNSQKGLCPYDWYNIFIECDFTGIGLTNTAKKFVDTVTWDTGTDTKNSDYYDYIDTSPKGIYEMEHSGKRDLKYKNGIERSAFWTGKIGLAYLSDIGYSIEGNENNPRSLCLSTDMFDDSSKEHWGDDYPDCFSSWLFNNEVAEIYLMTFDDLYGEESLFTYWHNIKRKTYSVYTYSNLNGGNVFPVFYLNSNAQIIEGKGTKENPYRFVIPEKKEISLKIGEKGMIELLNDNNINCLIENNDVIDIKDGQINALKVGTATIKYELLGTLYILEINVTEKDFEVENPKTFSDTGKIILISTIILIISLISYKLLFKHKLEI